MHTQGTATQTKSRLLTLEGAVEISTSMTAKNWIQADSSVLGTYTNLRNVQGATNIIFEALPFKLQCTIVRKQLYWLCVKGPGSWQWGPRNFLEQWCFMIAQSQMETRLEMLFYTYIVRLTAVLGILQKNCDSSHCIKCKHLNPTHVRRRTVKFQVKHAGRVLERRMRE